MSFYKIMMATQPLWDTYQITGETLSKAQQEKMWRHYVELIHISAVLPERRGQLCAQPFRQPLEERAGAPQKVLDRGIVNCDAPTSIDARGK